MRWLVIVVPLLIALAACEGPVGPEGPQGPPGDVGPEGPEGSVGAVHLIANSTIGADGTVTVEFPPGLGSLDDLSSLTCYPVRNRSCVGSSDRGPVYGGGDARGQSGDRSGERNAGLALLLRCSVLTIPERERSFRSRCRRVIARPAPLSDHPPASPPRTDRLSGWTRVT